MGRAMNGASCISSASTKPWSYTWDEADLVGRGSGGMAAAAAV